MITTRMIAKTMSRTSDSDAAAAVTFPATACIPALSASVSTPCLARIHSTFLPTACPMNRPGCRTWFAARFSPAGTLRLSILENVDASFVCFTLPTAAAFRLSAVKSAGVTFSFPMLIGEVILRNTILYSIRYPLFVTLAMPRPRPMTWLRPDMVSVPLIILNSRDSTPFMSSNRDISRTKQTFSFMRRLRNASASGLPLYFASSFLMSSMDKWDRWM